VLTGAVCEEVLFRGYAIESLFSLTSRLWLSGALAWALFTSLHLLLWGPGGTLQVGLWALLVTLFYILRRNLPAGMLVHGLNDGLGFLVVPLLSPAFH